MKTEHGRIVISDEDIEHLDKMGDGVIIHNVKIMYANPAALRLMGAGSLTDVLGMDVLRFVAPEYRDIVRFRIKETLNGTEYPSMVEKIITLDGRTVNVEVKSSPAIYKGQKAAIVFLKSENTKSHETALKRALSTFEKIADTLLKSSRDPYTDLGKLFHEMVETISPGMGFLMFRLSNGNLWLDFGRFMDEEVTDMLLPKEEFPIVWKLLESNADIEIVPDISERIRGMKCKCIFELESRIVSILGVPIRYDGKVRGAVVFMKEGYGAFLPWEIDILKTIARYVGIAMRLSGFIEKLELEREKYREKAMKDCLTGAYTRHFFEEWLAQFQEYLKRNDLSAALVVMDVDTLKLINDTWGHKMGDEVLKKFANAVIDNIRGMDVFVRIGGDEFLLVLPNAGREEAEKVIERIKKDFSESMKELGLKTSFSFGISIFGRDKNFGKAFEEADLELYSRRRSRGYNKEGE